MTNKKNLTTFALIMLIVGSIDSIRNLPTTALFGTTLIFFFVLAAIVFLIPAGLVSAELANLKTKDTGIYGWVNAAFGQNTGFFAIWLQWINTVVWYPTILSAIAATVAYLVNPQLVQNKEYLVTIILSVFWILTLVNLKGIKASANFVSICTIVGAAIPFALIILLAVIWVVSGKPVQIHMSLANMLPQSSHTENWVALTAIMTVFLGMELTSVHVNDMQNPQKTFPMAMIISICIIIVSMILGSLAIAFILPHNQISLVAGVIEAFKAFFSAYHIGWVLPIMAVMMVIGMAGGMINWIIAPAKGLLQAAENGYLPKIFAKTNKHNVPSAILITQAVLVSCVCLAFLLMPSVNGAYWLLTDLSTQLYILMYVLMFAAAIVLKYKYADQEKSFAIPGGKAGMWITALLGILGCIITLIVGFFPPGGINVGGIWHYEIVFGGGIVLMILPVTLFYLYKAFGQMA